MALRAWQWLLARWRAPLGLWGVLGLVLALSVLLWLVRPWGPALAVSWLAVAELRRLWRQS